MTIISCPNCHTEYEIDDDIIGMKVECEACHTKFLAGDASSSPVTRTKAPTSKFRINKKWIVAISIIGVILLTQTLTLIVMFSRRGVSALPPVNSTQTETPSELLLKYTEQGETAYVEALLKQNPSLDVDRPRRKTGSTALYTACRLGYVDIAKLLLRRNANANDDGQQGGFTPLTIAAFSGQLATVKLLLSSGVDIESQGRNNLNALFAAVSGNRADVVRFLCEAGAMVNIYGEYKNAWTPLTYAADNGLTEIVEILVQHGKDIDLSMKYRGYSERSPLELAMEKHYEGIVKILKDNIEKREKQALFKQNVEEANDEKDSKKERKDELTRKEERVNKEEQTKKVMQISRSIVCCNLSNNSMASRTKSIAFLESKPKYRCLKVRFINDPKKADATFYFGYFGWREAALKISYTHDSSRADAVYNVVDANPYWSEAETAVYIVKDASSPVDMTLCITRDKSNPDTIKIQEPTITSDSNQQRVAIMYMLGFFK